jgi:hypothetical protein
MTMKPVLCSACALALVALASAGQAQQKRPGAAPTADTPEVLPEPGGSGPPADGAEPPKKGRTTSAAGYAYADKPAASSKGVKHARYRHSGPVVNMPGFEQTSDGGSRLFVQLSQSVPVEERKAQGSITYVLKGASPRVWNNTNALVTVHFNTPVSRARLVPHGQDLLFIVDLRAGVTPTWKMNEGQDKTAMLAIEFPKGDFLATASAGGAAADTARPDAASRKKRGGGKTPPANAPSPAPAPAPAPASTDEPKP